MTHSSSGVHAIQRARAVARSVLLGSLLAGSAWAAGPSARASSLQAEQVDIVRDAQHVPHIYATTAQGGFYGVGAAMAEDRLFQMEFVRRTMRGRLSEVFDPVLYDRALKIDKRARLVGFGRHADNVALAIPDMEVRTILDAFCRGVNDTVSAPGFVLPPMFNQLGLTQFDPWTPGDCLLTWYYIQDLFDSSWGTEADAYGAPCPTLANQVIDPTGATVQSPYVIPLCMDDLSSKRRPVPTFWDELGRKASHGAVLSGGRSTSNAAVLLGKPQIQVYLPNLFYEYAVTGGAFDSRGAGLAGMPGVLVGWNRNVSWSVTAMVTDGGDLYKLQTTGATPAYDYYLDGVLTPMTNLRAETILVKNAAPVVVRYRETVWGPLVTGVVASGPTNQYALCHQMLKDTNKHTLEAMLGLMKATDWCTARAAMAKWRGPGVNLIYGDKFGHIGYTGLSALPIRPANAQCPLTPGGYPQDGSVSASAWTGTVPFFDQPWVLDPPQGFLVTGNNLAADPATMPGNIHWGAPGDTVRSWRLRELFENALAVPGSKLTPSQMLAFDTDSVDPSMRVFARLADQMLQNGAFTPGSNEHSAAVLLATWNQGLPTSQHYQLLSTHPLFAFLDALHSKVASFRRDAPFMQSLISTYGGGEGGLCHFLKTTETNLSAMATVPDVLSWAKNRLDTAWIDYSTLPPPSANIKLKFYGNLGGFGPTGFDSLDPSQDVTVGPFPGPLSNTIWSQVGESYKFLATMRVVDNAKAMLPPGVSEDPSHPSAFAHLGDWIAGNMYAAPLSRTLVQPTALSTTTIFY